MPKENKKILVIFDLVATLTDAGPRYVQALQDVCKERGLPIPDAEEVLGMLGNKNLSEITDAVLGKMEPAEKDIFMDECNHACDSLLYKETWHETLYPHVLDSVKELHASGVKLGIFTGTREDGMEAQVSYHGISDLFEKKYRRGKDNMRDANKTSDEIKAEQITSIIKQFKKDLGSDDVCVVIIGDSVSDAKAARKLGLSFIGFAENEKKKKRLEAASVEVIVRDFAELPQIVNSFKSTSKGCSQKPRHTPPKL